MEGKKMRLAAATAATVVAVLLLSAGQMQPVAAISEFCRCYKECYTECRKDSGPYPCNFGCIQQCINGDQQRPARPKSDADCNRICLIPICGTAATAVAAAGGGDAQACLVDCRNSIVH